MTRTLRLATRGSPLALIQARRVADMLISLSERRGDPGACEIVVVRTRGDEQTGKPISEVGGEGVFVKEVQQAVLSHEADLAVHSAKDLPSVTPEGLVLACVPERADPRDALIGARLEDLSPGATVATGSPRRRAQLAWLRPDLTFCELRGNISTRIEKAESAGAGVMAAAALERLGLADRIVQVLEPSEMLPQVGQGAIGVECRPQDVELLELLSEMDDTSAHRAVAAERSWLAQLGGGCSTPVAAYARPVAGDPGSLELEGMMASGDGRIVLRRSRVGSDPLELGRSLAADMFSRCGASVLEEWV